MTHVGLNDSRKVRTQLDPTTDLHPATAPIGNVRFESISPTYDVDMHDTRDHEFELPDPPTREQDLIRRWVAVPQGEEGPLIRQVKIYTSASCFVDTLGFQIWHGEDHGNPISLFVVHAWSKYPDHQDESRDLPRGPRSYLQLDRSGPKQQLFQFAHPHNSYLHNIHESDSALALG